MPKDKSLKDLQLKWYKRLEKAGFKDIEDTKKPNRPLNEWHNLKFRSERVQIIQANRSAYQREIDEFINHPSFIEACESMVRHGNCKFKQKEIHLIWSLHTEGLTIRTIARKLGRSKSAVQEVVEGLREWMRLL